MNGLVATAAGGLLLGLSFLIPHFGMLIFIALVPLFLHMDIRPGWCTYWQALLAGIVAFSLANYWIYLFLFNLSDSHWLAAALSSIYFFFGANAIAMLFLILRFLRRRLPFFGFAMLAPLIGSVFLHFYPLLFDLNLAQTLTQYSILIVPLALTGPWLLAALILFVNLLLAECLMVVSRWIKYRHSSEQNQRIPTTLAKLAAGLLLIPLLWLCLGRVCESDIRKGEIRRLTLGIIQTDDAPGAAAPAATAGNTLAYPQELKWAYVLAEQGAQIIAWPESRSKGILTNDWVREAHHIHAQHMNADLIIQELAKSESSDETYINASLLFSRKGRQAQYRKMTPIPFGEAIPASFSFEPLKTWIAKIFQGIYKPIIAGTEIVLFEVGEHTIMPLICYEIFNRRHIIDTVVQNPDIDLIVLQSNDRWFFSRHQVYMHNAVARLRAAESSRPVLHVVNGGPSFFIDARGRVTAVTEYRRAGAYLLEVKLPQFRSR